MQEVNINISGHKSKSVDEFINQEFDYAITVCDKANVRVVPGNARHIHWSFDDPAAAKGDEEQRLVVFRRVRDEIRQRVQLFLRG